MLSLPRSRSAAFSSLAALALLVSLVACTGPSGPLAIKSPDPQRVEAHSEGLVASGSALKVVLTRAAGIAGTAGPKEAFRFYPPLAGSCRWEDERTLAFTPDKPLRAGKGYRAEFDLGLIGGEAPMGPDYFSFDFRSAGQRISVQTLPPRVSRDGGIAVEGTLSLSELSSSDAAEKALSSSEGSISWSHESGTLHRFTVSGIASTARARDLVLRWDGKSLGGGGKGKLAVKLPSSSRFELLGAASLGGGVGRARARVWAWGQARRA